MPFSALVLTATKIISLPFVLALSRRYLWEPLQRLQAVSCTPTQSSVKLGLVCPIRFFVSKPIVPTASTDLRPAHCTPEDEGGQKIRALIAAVASACPPKVVVPSAIMIPSQPCGDGGDVCAALALADLRCASEQSALFELWAIARLPTSRADVAELRVAQASATLSARVQNFTGGCRFTHVIW